MEKNCIINGINDFVSKQKECENYSYIKEQFNDLIFLLNGNFAGENLKKISENLYALYMFRLFNKEENFPRWLCDEISKYLDSIVVSNLDDKQIIKIFNGILDKLCNYVFYCSIRDFGDVDDIHPITEITEEDKILVL